MSHLLDLVRLSKGEKEARGLVYTPAEIAQQPDTWKTTIQTLTLLSAEIQAFLEGAGLKDTPERRPTILLAGAGTSDYIGRSLALLLRKQWDCEVLAVPSTDLLTSFEAYILPDRRYLCISFSRSGDSPEGVAVLEHAIEHYPGMAQVIVTCNPHSRMYALGHAHKAGFVIVLDDAVNDRSLAMTSSFTNMVIAGQCLAHAWDLETYRPVLDRMAESAAELLTTASAVASRIATRHFKRVILVGSDAYAAIAKESALKVLEMSSGLILTSSETVLGLRHGPMAALNSETLFVCFLSGENSKQSYELDLVREVHTKGISGHILVIGNEGSKAAVEALGVEYLSVPGDLPDAYGAPVDVIFGQLLGLFCSIENGMKPDAPSPDGVINRVVQDFAIYR